MDLYVYYRVDCAHAEALHALATAMQQALARQSGVATGLKRRPQVKDGRHTWMEIYLNIPEGFDMLLQQALSASGMDALIDGERHLEYFLDVSSCA